MNELTTNDNAPVKQGEALGFVQSKPESGLVSVHSEKEISEVKAMVSIAKMFPRSQKTCIDNILNACCRESLATTARYTYKRGNEEVTGPTIDLIEAIAQLWGNLKWGWKELERTKDKSICMSFAWDVENNTYQAIDVVVPHYRDTKYGRKPLRDDRDIYEHTANMATRRMRSCLENIIPRDVIELAQQQCDKTLACNVEVNEQTIKKLLDTFLEEYGVTRKQIEKRIQRNVESMTPQQMVTLRHVFKGLKTGMGTVQDYFDPEEEKESPKKSEALKEKLKAKTSEKPLKKEVKDEVPEPKSKTKVPLDAKGNPMWSSYLQDITVQVDKAIELKSKEILMMIQMDTAEDAEKMKQAAPSIHDDLVELYSKAFESIGE